MIFFSGQKYKWFLFQGIQKNPKTIQKNKNANDQSKKSVPIQKSKLLPIERPFQENFKNLHTILAHFPKNLELECERKSAVLEN